ncbi:hypothetical protein [Komagataeibacter sp. FNDCR2]|uniref:hypothetical protein n=1 Tax=Komagataeibacter sp. FNDCR2 TaxID=2878682 RepID=UPI001E2CBAFB|nr:hypothetical protein [Komagataeibacter sp. FNDCR2]MCE2574791.1 hypothetical protein [Komagataeibacter sp. FNDCR2]
MPDDGETEEMKRIIMAFLLFLPMSAQARSPVPPSRWTTSYVPTLEDWQAALLYNGSPLSIAMGEEISRATGAEGLKLNRSGDTSTNQNLTTPILTNATVGAATISLSSTTLPFRNSSGARIATMDTSGNFNVSGYLSTLYEVVPDYLKGAGNNGADDAPWIQKAVATVCAAGGGTVRFLPRHYVIDSEISIGCPVTLQGAGWLENYSAQSPAAALGTWFDIDETTVPPVYVHDIQSRGTQIRDIAFWQPGQTAPAANATSWTPVIYPPVIYLHNVEGYTLLRNLFMDGVLAGVNSVNGGRTIIEGLYGQFFDYSVNIDADADVSRINNIHAWPYWSGANAVMSYQEAHSQAVKLGRVDSPFLDNIFVLPARAGIYFYAGTNSFASGVATGVQVGKLSCDSTVNCLEVAASGVVVTVNSLRTFGQNGASSGTPASGASVMMVDSGGAVSAYLGQVEGRMLFNAAFTFNAKYSLGGGCSNVRIASLAEDFGRSTENGIYTALGKSACSSSSTAANQVLLATPPSVFTNSSVHQVMKNSGGIQTGTWWAVPTKQP